MRRVLGAMSNAAKQAVDVMSAAVVGQVGGVGEADEMIDSYRSKLDDLAKLQQSLKERFHDYQKAMSLLIASGSALSDELSAFYHTSSSRASTLSMFIDTQLQLEIAAEKLYKEAYGWELLKQLDDWAEQIEKQRDNIKKTDSARVQVGELQEKVTRMRHAKERRLQSKGQPLTEKEESVLRSSEEMLAKYSAALDRMRAALDRDMSNFLNNRFQVMDSVFVRFMELQRDYAAEAHKQTVVFTTTTENYRKRFPRGFNWNAAAAASTPTSSSASALTGLSSPTHTSATHPTVASAKPIKPKTPTTVNSSSDDKPSSATPTSTKKDTLSAPVATTPSQKQRSPSPAHPPVSSDHKEKITPQPSPHANDKNVKHPSHKRQPSEDEEEEEETDEEESGEEEEEDEDEDKPPVKDRQREKEPVKAPASQRGTPSSSTSSSASTTSATSPSSSASSVSSSSSVPLPSPSPMSPPNAKKAAPVVVDFLNFDNVPAPSSSASPQPTKPSAAAATTFDIFEGASSSSSTSSSSSASSSSSSKQKSPVNDDDIFSALSGAGDSKKSGGGSSSSNNSRSSTRNNNNAKNDDLGEFGEFMANGSIPSKASNSTSSHKPTSAAVEFDPFADAPVKITTLDDIDESPPSSSSSSSSSGLDDIDDGPSLKLPFPESQVDEKLQAWEFNKQSQPNHIRTLLSNLHTILWKDSGWKAMSLPDLMDYNALKKAHRKAVIVIHPDKHCNSHPTQLRMSQKLFTAMNTAYQRMETEAKAGRAAMI